MSIKDIANISGVSIATVSRVLNNKGKYSSETAQKVLAVAKSGGYVTNYAAKSLRESKTRTIGVLIPDLKNAFFAEIAHAIETYLFQYDYSVLICNSGNDPQKELQYFQTLISRGVDGILCISDIGMLPLDLKSRNIPIVFLDRHPKVANSVHWVGNDNIDAAKTATNHLIEQGCKNILFISNFSSDSRHNTRQIGYEQALAEHNIFIDQNYILQRVGDDPTPVKVELLVSNFIQLQLPLDGIVTCSEAAALGTLFALRRYNISVPNDVKLVSFDNTITSLLSYPALTSVERNPHLMSKQACDILLDVIDGKNPETLEYVIPTSLVKRESSKIY